MAKKKKGTGRTKKGRGQKPTTSDKSAGKLGPRPIEETPEQIAAREAAEFEARKRAAIAKAAVELDHVDGRILELMLKYPKITQEQIGDIVGLTRQTVNERVNADKFQNALKLATRAALEIFQGNQAAAARKLGALIHSKDDRIAVRASIAHLWPFIHGDKAGGGGEDFVAFIQEAYELAQEKGKGTPAEDQPAETAEGTAGA